MYAIVYSKLTGEKWPTALKQLKEKYERRWKEDQIHVICYQNEVDESLPELSHVRPSYTCFLTHFEECTQVFVSCVHRLTRRLDPSTPFTDTIWGILTGLTEEDVSFAISSDSLTVSRVLGGTGVDLTKFESGLWYNEGKACDYVSKSRGNEEILHGVCPQDTTGLLVKELSDQRDVENDVGVDMMVTSGHATERDWCIGYSYPNGKFICRSSRMMGLAMDGHTHPIVHNGRPKILSAAGNCLVGNIDESNCMALAWMHSVGVVQMTGYLLPTWYGYGGWGVHSYFINLPGALSFAESFFANHQALLAKLHKEYNQHELLAYNEYNGNSKDCCGLLYDRDIVAFYGDPAFEARLVHKADQQAYTIDVNEVVSEANWKTFELILTVNHKFNRFPIHIFSRSVANYKILSGDDGDDVIITCRFVMIARIFNPGDTARVVFAVQN
jgi:zinc protease